MSTLYSTQIPDEDGDVLEIAVQMINGEVVVKLESFDPDDDEGDSFVLYFDPDASERVAAEMQKASFHAVMNR